MSEKNVKKSTEEINKVEEPAAEPVKKPVAKAKTKEETTVKKKDGLFTRTKNWCKRNKSALIAGGVGLAAGVGGTIGVGEVAKRRAEKRGRQNRNSAYIQEDYSASPLDPNV